MTDRELRAFAEKTANRDSVQGKFALAVIVHLDFCEARAPKVKRKVKRGPRRDHKRPAAPEYG